MGITDEQLYEYAYKAGMNIRYWDESDDLYEVDELERTFVAEKKQTPREKRKQEVYIEPQDEIDETTGMPKGVRVSPKRRAQVIARLNRTSLAVKMGIMGYAEFPGGTVGAITQKNVRDLSEVFREAARDFEDVVSNQ